MEWRVGEVKPTDVRWRTIRKGAASAAAPQVPLIPWLIRAKRIAPSLESI